MCHYCMIVSRQLPASIVYEDDCAIAFLVIKPVTPGHVVVIPKKHIESLIDLSEGQIGRLMDVVKRVDQAMQASDLVCEGVSIYLADGRAAGQRVPHLHFHVIPRFRGDEFEFSLDFDMVKHRGISDLEEDALKIMEGFKRV